MFKRGQVNLDFLSNVDKKTGILLLAVAFSLFAGFSDNLTGNYASVSNKYFSPPGGSQCERFGGTVFTEDRGEVVRGKLVELITLAENVVVVSVDGQQRAVKSGHEVYINGLDVTLYSTATNAACLIVD